MTIIDKIKTSNILDPNNEVRIDEAIYKKISNKLITIILSPQDFRQNI